MALDILSYLMGKAAGGSGGGMLQPAYQGYSYGYIVANDGTFYNPGESNDSYINVYEVEAGKTYVFFVGETVGNRLRPTFFAGKTYADFAPYITEPASYQLDGQYLVNGDPSGDSLLMRIYLTPNTAGTVIIGTSNNGVQARFNAVLVE